MELAPILAAAVVGGVVALVLTRWRARALSATPATPAETERQAMDARIAAFAHVASDFFWETDAEFRIVWMEGDVERITGFGPDFFIGRNLREMGERQRARMDPMQWRAWQRFFEIVERRQAFDDFEYPGIHRSGRRIDLSSSARPLLDAAGNFRGLRGTTRDVTARVRAGHALEESRARLRALLDNAPIILWELDADGRFVYSDGAGLQRLGLRPGQAVGTDAFELYRDFPFFAQQIRASLAGETRHFVTERNGNSFDNFLFPLRSPEGAVTGLMGVSTDISQRAAAEADLERRKRYFGALIESMRDVTVVVRRDRTIAFVSPSVEATLGFRIDEALGRSIYEFIDPEFQVAARARFDEIAAKAGPILRTDVPLRDREGVSRIFEIASVNLLDDPDVGGIVLNCRDVSERRSIERQLMQAQKMEVVGQLTGGIAHDFNNLLAIVLGNLELLREALDHDHQRRDLADRALGAAERGALLTQRLLAFSRRQTLEPRTLDLNSLLQGLVQLIGRTLGEHIDVSLECATHPLPCRVDPNQLETAILNLAVNARDAMPKGGSLTIRTALVDVQREDLPVRDRDASPGRYVAVSVSDTGQGMPRSVLDRAFEPFFTTKEVGRGSGLGLSMVYGFVRQSGGFVRILSEPGHGTNVTVHLPAAPETASAAANPPPGAGEPAPAPVESEAR